MPYPHHKDHDSYEDMRQESEREKWLREMRRRDAIDRMPSDRNWDPEPEEEVAEWQADGMDSTMGKLT